MLSRLGMVTGRHRDSDEIKYHFQAYLARRIRSRRGICVNGDAGDVPVRVHIRL